MEEGEIADLIRAFFYGLLALIGGLVSYLVNTESYSFKGFLVKGIGSGFSGFLIGLLCIYFQVPTNMSFAISGTFGYLGAEVTIVFLHKYLIKHLPK